MGEPHDHALNGEQACNHLSPRFGFCAMQQRESFGFEFMNRGSHCLGTFEFELDADLRNRVSFGPHVSTETCLSGLGQRPYSKMVAALKFFGGVVLTVQALQRKAQRIYV